jgi:hypothetical protein
VIDPFLLAAVALLVAGVAGVFLPVVPGPALSVGGVWLYWWSTGYTEPGVAVVAALSAVGLLAVVVEFTAEYLGARVGGASTLASVAGTVVGVALLFVLGPVGMLLGLAATIVAVEVYRGADLRSGLRAATVAVAAALASGLVQAVLAVGMLAVFLVSVLG